MVNWKNLILANIKVSLTTASYTSMVNFQTSVQLDLMGGAIFDVFTLTFGD